MSLCAQCGLHLRDNSMLCPHHGIMIKDWAAANRVLCDLLHRGIVPARLSEIERHDEYWAVTE